MNNIIKKYCKTISMCSKGGEDGKTPLVISDQEALYVDGFAKHEVFTNVPQFQTIDAFFDKDKKKYYIEFKDTNVNSINAKQLEGKIVASLIILHKYCDVNVFYKKDKYFVLVVKNNLERLGELFNMSGVNNDINCNCKNEKLIDTLEKYHRYYFEFFTDGDIVKPFMTSNEFKKKILNE